MRDAAAALRKEKRAPKELPVALANAAAGIRQLEQMLSAVRSQLARQLAYVTQGSALVASVARLDASLDQELEKDVLYLEELFDKRRAEDLVRMGKDLSQRRRDLASLLEKYKDAPDEAKKKELLAEVARMKARMKQMMQRMAELAKGLSDEHMNAEALAELQKSNDAMGGLDEVEKKLAQGDVEGAMKALDQLGNAMQQMLAGLERNAGSPDRKNSELMKEMLSFKKDLEDVQAEQERVARETETMKQAYQKKLGDKLKEAEAKAKKLEQLAEESRREVGKAESGVNLRSEEDFAQSRDRLGDLQKALAARDFDAALESVKRALPPMQRLAMGLGDEADMSERYRALGTKDPKDLREAQKHAAGAIGPARKVQEELEKLFPDPKGVLGQNEQKRLGELQGQQGALERKAGALRKKLEELAQRAPVFPPQAKDMLAGSQGHMMQAENELGQKNPQRGHGEQRQALDELSRFKKGLDEMAKNAKNGGQSGGGFPFPFGTEDQGQREGDGTDPSQEKVEIPGAEAYKVPEEFRKDLLEAMKQGAPEPYKGDLQRYYEELVK
jgi:chromosome segregation ATPase